MAASAPETLPTSALLTQTLLDQPEGFFIKNSGDILHFVLVDFKSPWDHQQPYSPLGPAHTYDYCLFTDGQFQSMHLNDATALHIVNPDDSTDVQ